jgi:hypothetical protein
MNATRTVVSVLLVAGAMLFAAPLEAVDCLRPVGELPEGPSLAVDMEGSLAAFGRGRVLVVVDLSDPSDPVELGSVVLPGVVESVELTATHAWVAAGPAGLVGVDVTDPTQPAIVSHLPAGLAGEPATAADLAFSGGLVFVAETFERWDGSPRARLRVIDISVPRSPADVGVWESQQYGHAGRVAVAGGLAALIESDWESGPGPTSLIDVSASSGAAKVGQIEARGYDLAISGATLFNVGDGGFAVYNISDPAHPILAAGVSTGRFHSAVAVNSGLLVVGGTRPYYQGIPFGAWLYDISPPWLPTEIGFVETPAPVAGLAAGGGRVLAAAGRAGLRVIDISDPNQPTEIADLEARGSIDWVSVVGSLALVASSNQVSLVDIADPARPIERADLAVPFRAAWCRPALEGSVAYVASSYPDGVAVFDVSDPGNPAQITFLSLDSEPVGLDASGSGLYAITEGNRLLAIDVADPGTPVVVGDTRAGEAGPAERVAADGDYVTVANGSCPWGFCYPAIQLFYVASSAQPERLDTLYYPYAYAIAPHEDFIFFAGEGGWVDNGLAVVDRSDPTRLREVAGLELPGEPTGIAVGEDMAYVSIRTRVGSRSVQLVSLRNPLDPWFMGEHRTPGGAWDVALSGDTLLVADGDAGLLLLDATECAFPPPRHPAGRLLPGSGVNPDP